MLLFIIKSTFKQYIFSLLLSQRPNDKNTNRKLWRGDDVNVKGETCTVIEVDEIRKEFKGKNQQGDIHLYSGNYYFLNHVNSPKKACP